jgi:signal transduction histidine kinase/DNA-binding response OmpR family regulator
MGPTLGPVNRPLAMLDRVPRVPAAAAQATPRRARTQGALPNTATLLTLASRICACAAQAESLVQALDGVTQLLHEGLAGRAVTLRTVHAADAATAGDATGSPGEGATRLAVVHAGAWLAAIDVEAGGQGPELTALLDITRSALEQAAARTAVMTGTSLELARCIDEGLFISDPLRSNFQFLADSAYETWGVAREPAALRPEALLAHVVEADRGIFADSMTRERQGLASDITFRIDHPRKGRRWLHLRTRPLPGGAHGPRLHGMVSDVTAERQHAVELEGARDAAEAASRAKSQFMANMSHEIRTPMNGILGMTELLLGTALSEQQRRFAQAVYGSGESLLEIINDILDFSKIEAGKLELAVADFMPRAIVEDTLELLAPRAHAKGLEISFREEPGLFAVARGDALRLRQVLTNLVANAIKFTEYGEIVVDLRRAPPRGADVALALEFRVRDTGIGIHADALPLLFRSFTQGNAGTSKRYGGTGLGLAIVRQLVELMGGHLEVSSAPGLGSEFSFVLPFAKPLNPHEPSEPDSLHMAALRVLVVDDNETNRCVLENMLGAWGMKVSLAEDGQQALEILQGGTATDPRFDLALVDLHMPRLDGMGLARALKDAGSHPEMKMILLSSTSAPDDALAAQQVGFASFVAKPVRRAELRQAIQGAALPRRALAQPAPALNLDVLVVEDNGVNQEVIGQMLRSLGCRARVASGALEGLRALCDKRFDLVLMDIQMPGMDGVEALSWFRRGSGSRFNFVTPANTPVIAVTANALSGDEARFLSLGFDDYLSKPFRRSQLQAVMMNCIDPSSQPAELPAAGAAAEPAAAPAAADSVLDADALQRLRELDPTGANKLLARVLTAFQTSTDRLLPQMQTASVSNDLQGVRHVAHTLKSSSASIGALRLSELCAQLETMIRNDRVDALEPRVQAVAAEVEIVLKALQRLMGNPP